MLFLIIYIGHYIFAKEEDMIEFAFDPTFKVNGSGSYIGGHPGSPPPY